MFRKSAYLPTLADRLGNLGLLMALAAVLISTSYLVCSGLYTTKISTGIDVFPGVDGLPDPEIQQILK